MHIVGTAGHVDHGKSSLVRALTGTDPDRWIEERLRGMTLDLGFAHLTFEDGVEAGIVDVPGHERFLHNMLAGAAGMEMLLLVVDANEGVMPQTREHLEILQYLNVKQTIVVLSKIDALESAERELAEALVRAELAGTMAGGARLVAVSSVSGEGLPQLRDAIHEALLKLAPRRPEAPAYLPVDRVFTLPGLGTIVTGTLMQGSIATGERLRLSPPGREVRIRSLQVFGEQRERVDGGARVALNLPGIETSEISRGAVLCAAQFAPAADFEVTFRALPQGLAILRRRMAVRTYIGAAEILGTLVFVSTPHDTEAVTARLHLRRATVCVPGAAFVVRRLSPKTLLGGGTIAGLIEADGDEPHAAAVAPDAVALAAALKAAGLAGTSAARAGAAANVREERASEILAQLVSEGRAFELARPGGFVDGALAEELFERVRARLAESEHVSPWLAGATVLALSRALGVPEGPLARLLTLASQEGRIAHRFGYYASPDFVPQLSVEQRAFFDRAFARDGTQPNQPVALDELIAALRAEKVTGLAQAFETLLESGALIKVYDAVYRGEQIAQIRTTLEATLRRDKQITMAGFRDLVGTSRKFAVPLLEWFDAHGVTIRSGDIRVLKISKT